MKPLIIFPTNQKEITISIEDLEKYIHDAYDSGYRDGYNSRRDTVTYPKIMFTDKGTDKITVRNFIQ